MAFRKNTAVLAISFFALTITAGCASKGTQTDTAANEKATPVSVNKQDSISATALSDSNNQKTSGQSLSAINNDNQLVNSDTIYFDYDSAELTASDKAIVEQYAQQLLSDPRLRVRLEGHADERGSREYNMALGEKRAFAIKKLLELKGVGKSQIETVSFGEERPEIEGHGEDSWKQNRRAVFVYASN